MNKNIVCEIIYKLLIPIIIILLIFMVLLIGCDKNIESDNIDEFIKDMKELYIKGNVTFSLIYTNLPNCQTYENSTFMIMKQNNTPKYWIEFNSK